MFESTVTSEVTSRGQTTVPSEVRESLGAIVGTRLASYPLPDGSVVVRAKNRSIMDLAGRLEPPHGKHVTIDEMSARR